MHIFNVRSFSLVALVAATTFFSACTEEKKEPLPDLPPVELPKDISGLYSGSLPCDDCTAKMVLLTLNEDKSVVAVQTTVKESSVVDTLKGTFELNDSTVMVSLTDKNINWNFKRIESGNLSYLTSAGTVYEDENGMRADFMKIYKVPLKRVLKSSDVPADSAKE